MGLGRSATDRIRKLESFEGRINGIVDFGL